MLIDTHAHVNFVVYKDDGDEVIKRALEQNVWIINVGSQYETSRRAVECAHKYPEGVFAAVGLHPIHLKAQEINAPVDEFETVEFETGAEKFDYERYKALAQNEKVVAIGEIGLDYYHIKNQKSKIKNQDEDAEVKMAKMLQREILLEQMALAQELDKAAIFHCREAHQDLLEVLKNWEFVGNKRLRGVVHSFSGRWSQAQEYLEMGFYLGFNGIITFARDYDRVIKEMPLDRLLAETDCPYLTPIPFRGKRNEPTYVKYVAEKVAELREISFEEVAEATTKNARELFNI
ncbi:MAG: TatD DNase family protein [Parcubacteria group bacterium LiPW_39]|nr:MAG: TatD DNase family protein [Parcubacteria group bacterium LiPW_39]